MTRGAGAAAKAAIAVDDITKAFRGRQVLTGVNLDVTRGSVTAMLGRNGAGKTTLLRILATTVVADGGRASVAGYDVARQGRAVRGAIGTVFGDDRGWYDRLSARRNLEFFGQLRGLRAAHARDRAQALLEQFELAGHADRPVSGYSSGMRSRLALARATMSDPPVLLLDEPSSHLDAVAGAQLHDRLRELAAGGTTVLVATHDLHEAAGLADRFIGLAGGRIAFVRDGPASAAELEERLVSWSQ